jgi:hypothetical protein
MIWGSLFDFPPSSSYLHPGPPLRAWHPKDSDASHGIAKLEVCLVQARLSDRSPSKFFRIAFVLDLFFHLASSAPVVRKSALTE